jgi:hypothetical protein
MSFGISAKKETKIPAALAHMAALITIDGHQTKNRNDQSINDLDLYVYLYNNEDHELTVSIVSCIALDKTVLGYLNRIYDVCEHINTIRESLRAAEDELDTFLTEPPQAPIPPVFPQIPIKETLPWLPNPWDQTDPYKGPLGPTIVD